uniref:Uncharacterized protein n=1 Tax=Avena sativa TaxID=4498 RepID=A0ACD5ZAJ1_AVESA
MDAMGSVTKLFNDWEIQLLVFLSFTLQLFLFFTGRLRCHTTSGFLRLSIWAAYLGADLVAVYALGYLSKHEDITLERDIPKRTHALAFFWAPFLLIHLGGQDTITAFAMEDNNLWLRHLLNVVVQIVLAIYVFWKSIGRHSVDLLVSGIFVFSAGVIKYGERIWSLKCGSLKDLESSTGGRYKNRLPQDINGDGYDNIVCEALHSMSKVYDIFSGRSLFTIGRLRIQDSKMPKMVSIALGVFYDDLYTKALVLRTMSIIILRCISQVFVVVAFALFIMDEKQKYSQADIAITYALFIGGFLIEICAVLAWMMSPWTWAWLNVQKWDMLAKLTWFILSSDIGWPEKKQWWPKSTGQYSLVRWLSTGSNVQKARTFSQRLMALVKRLSADWFGVKRNKIFWMSKMLDTENVDVDKMMLEYVVKEIILLQAEMSIGPGHKGPREWPNLGRLLEETQVLMVADFGMVLVWLHFVSEAHLSKYSSLPPPDMEASTSAAAAAAAEIPDLGMVEVCRKLSNYMMYLLVTHPSMLPLAASAAAALERYQEPEKIDFLDFLDKKRMPEPSKEALEELVYMWTRMLIYAAGKSTRVEMHIAWLSTGGELITLVWLLMARYGIGESQSWRIQIANADTIGNTDVRQAYAFYVSPDEGSKDV